MPRKRDEAAHAARRAEIRAAAARLFAERGFHATGMAALCEALAMSPGALYRYYPSKGAIIRDLVADDRADSLALLAGLESAPDFFDALVARVDEARRAVSEPGYGRLALEIAAEAGRDESIGRIVADAEEAVRDRLAAALRDAPAGTLGRGIDPRVAARLVLQLIDGATGAGHLRGRARRAERMALRRTLAGLLGRGNEA